MSEKPKARVSSYHDAVMKQRRFQVYMDGIDFEHHLVDDMKGVVVYPTQEACIQGEGCLRSGAGCGVVKLEVRLLEWVVPQDLGHGKGQTFKESELAERVLKTAKARALHIRPGLRCVYGPHLSPIVSTYGVLNEDGVTISTGETEELAWVAALKTGLNRRGKK